MQISDVMTSHVEVVRPDASVKDVAIRMRDLDVGSLPVCDGNRILGMISDRDITLRVTAEGKNAEQTRVQEVMSANIIYCYEDEDISEAGKVMGYNQIRRLPILNREKRLVGILSLGDISTEAKNDKLSGKTLKDVSVPAKTIK